MEELNANWTVGANEGNLTGLENDNSTSDLEEGFIENVVPQWVVIIYFVVISVGTFCNVCVIIALLKSKRKGIFELILQLAAVDIIATFVAVLEVLALRSDTWGFSSDLCPLFSGSEVLTNSLTVYLLICLNFHVISIWNLHFYQVHRGSKNPLTSCIDEDSNECLVQKNDGPSTSRALTIDYRRRKDDVSIIFPSLLIWFICLSLSIPEYTLSSTIKTRSLAANSTVCTIVDIYYGELLQNLLLVFRALIPFPLLLLTFFILLFKLYQSKRRCAVENALSKHLAENQTFIMFCLILSLLYFLMSLPRNVLYAMHTNTQKITGESLENFKIPPLHNIYISAYQGTFLSMIHYSSLLFRTFVYVFFLPMFQKTLNGKIFIRAKSEE